MKNIALVMGGYSGEHDISIMSGEQVYQALDKSKYQVYKIVIERDSWYWLADDGSHRPLNRANFTLNHNGTEVHFHLAFIIIHGNPGENGVLQGYLDMLGIPYTGCGFYTSALTFHKGYCNAVVRESGLVHVARNVLMRSIPTNPQEVIDKLGLPLFVKPAAGGSSVATTKVKCAEELLPAIREAFTEDHEVLVEEFIGGREFGCGVLQTQQETLAFPVTEIIPKGNHEFFDYAAKYEGHSSEVTPAEIPEALSTLIRSTSTQLYALLGCRGLVRFDYIYNTSTSQLYFLEVNTIPGQSAESIVPKQARAMGISTPRLYEMIIEAAL